MGTIIGSVTFTPAQPRRGESVLIEVRDADGHPLEGRADVEVTIDGVPGARQWWQFAAAGDHTVVVEARAAGARDRAAEKIAVTGAHLAFKATGAAGELAELPLLRLVQSRANPYRATFSVGDGFAPDAGLTPPRRRRRDARLRALPRPARATPRLSRADVLAARRRLRTTGTRPTSRLERTLTSLAVARDAQPGGTGIRTTRGRLVDRTVYDVRDTAIAAALAGLRAAMPARYEWDFGDGTSAVTSVPHVEHDYFFQLEHAARPRRFDVTCRIVHAGVEVKRTLNLTSAYALCRARGVVVPHSSSEIYAHKHWLGYQAAVTVYNVEDQPLTLTKQAIVAHADSPTAPETPKAFTALATPIVLPPRSSTTISITTPIGGAVPGDAAGFTVYYAGAAGDGAPVRLTAIFEVPLAERDHDPQPPHFGGVLTTHVWPWEEVTRAIDEVIRHAQPDELAPVRVQVERASGTIATSWQGVRDVGKLAGARRAHDRVLAARLAPALRRSLPLERPAPTLTLSAAARVRLGRLVGGALAATRLRRPMGAPPPAPPPPPAPGPIAAGEICDPDNLTEAERATADQQQLVCQLTGEIEEVLMPGRFMNARKGDIILSPGGTGLIGTLLRNVDPPQQYSHSGMMTRNYDELTHSTASEELIDEYIDAESPTDGLPANMIKYMWPGVVTQPVEAAIHGEPYPHPETGKQYSISSFGTHAVGVTHNGQFMMVPPLVVKPDPLLETDAIRAKLHAVADWARGNGYRPGGTPKSHYRLFAYTDPTIGQTTTAPASAGWAKGTFPSVCSSLCWMANKAKGTFLETHQATVMPADLESKDVAAGAFVAPATPDGLYTYTAAERLKAGQWLYDTIYYMGYDAAGWLGEALTDAADDLANQLCNVFANDDAEGQDHEGWKDQRDANAVSPDNLLWWDGPDKGGLYGYAEPLIYREPRKEQYPISKWKKVVTRGTLTGKVRWQGQPIGGANVRVFDGASTLTSGAGVYTLTNVPLGNYNLVASKVIDGKYCSVSKLITIDKEHHTIDLDLQPPAEDFRLATVYFDFWGEDYETFGSNEHTDPGPEAVQLELGPDRLINSFSKTYKWGGELRCEYKFTVRLLVGNVIDLQIDCKLFEGTDESTDDLDGTGSLHLQASMGQTAAGTLRVWNTAEDEPEDQGVLTVSISNDQNNN